MIGLRTELLDLGTKQNLLFFLNFEKRVILDIIYKRKFKKQPLPLIAKHLNVCGNKEEQHPYTLFSLRSTPHAHFYLQDQN